jgi:hypothetical protein
MTRIPQVGEWWVNRKGLVIGPLKETGNLKYPLSDGNESYTASGRIFADKILPGDLIEPAARNPTPEPSTDAALRDEIAIKAAIAVLKTEAGRDLDVYRLADGAYSFADAMMERRKK